MHPHIRVLAAGILFTSLVLIPGVQAAESYGLENFDTLTTGLTPYAETGGAAPFYNYFEGGTGTEDNYVFTNEFSSSPKSLYVDRNAASDSTIVFPEFGRNDSLEFCSDLDRAASFKFRMDALPPAGKQYFFGLSEGLNAFNDISTNVQTYSGIVVSESGSVETNINDGESAGADVDSDTFLGLTLTADSWVEVTLAHNCASERLTAVVNGVTAVSDISSISASNDLQFLTLGIPFGAGDLPYIVSDLWVDDVAFTDGAGNTPATGSRFCANIALTPENASEPHEEWGYEYTDGIRSIEEARDNGDVGIDISMDDGFYFAGDTSFSSWDFVAKHFPTGSKAMHTAFQIEASSTDFVSSRFRAVYTLDDTSAPTDTTRGDGFVTGNFDNHVEVEVTETGDTWQVQVYYAEPTVNSGARTALGPSAPFGSANDPTSFMFWYDSRASATPGEAKNFTTFGTTGFGFVPGGGTLQAGPYIAVTRADDDDQVPDRDQVVVAFRSLQYGPGPGNSLAVSQALQDTEINTQWFIGYGTSGLTGAETALNDNKVSGEDSNDSTCIWDDTGTSVVGAQGSGTAPGSSVTQPVDGDDDATVCSSPFCVDDSTVPEGFTVAAFNLFLGMLLAAAIAAGFAGITKGSPMGMLVGAIVGLVLAFTFGLMPLWPILVIVAAAVAFVFYSFRGTGA